MSQNTMIFVEFCQWSTLSSTTNLANISKFAVGIIYSKLYTKKKVFTFPLILTDRDFLYFAEKAQKAYFIWSLKSLS